MLQNEEFMAELRRDHDFMSALEEEDEQHGRQQQPHPYQQQPQHPQPPKRVMDEAAFREKLKNMGKSSKRKFAQMASMFSGHGAAAGVKKLGGGGGGGVGGGSGGVKASKDNLLSNAE